MNIVFLPNAGLDGMRIARGDNICTPDDRRHISIKSLLQATEEVTRAKQELRSQDARR